MNDVPTTYLVDIIRLIVREEMRELLERIERELGPMPSIESGELRDWMADVVRAALAARKDC